MSWRSEMGPQHSKVEEVLGRGIAQVCLFSVKHRGAVLLLLLLVTAGFGFGLTKIYVRSADYDLLPDGHPSTIANAHALNEVPGYRSIESVFMESSDPDGNITTPQAIRAADSLENYIRERVPEIKYTYSLAYLVKLVNYTLSGVPNPACNLQPPVPTPVPLPPVPQLPGDACTPQKPNVAAFGLPQSDSDIERNYKVIEQANFNAIKGVVDARFHGTLVVFMYDFNLTKQGPQAVLPASARFLAAVHEFRDSGACDSLPQRVGDRSLINCRHVYVLGEAINAHMTELANQDFITFGPIVFVATLLVLVFAFNDLVSTLIAAIAFTLGLVWTYGFMGFLGIPLTFFGLLIVPITLGVGKEYAIYITNQYLEYQAEGRTREDSFTRVGHGAGAALLIASVTSVAGVATMALANFFIMRDLAILTCFSFGALFLISITFIPAAQALRRPLRRPRPFKPSATMSRLAVGLRRHRVAVAAVAVLITVGAALEATRIEEYFGLSGGFKKGDYLEESYQYYNQVLGGSGTELVVIEAKDHQAVGDPATIQYLRTLDNAFKADTATIPKASNVNSLIIALDTYYALRDGLLNPKAAYLAAGQSPIPNDAATVARDIDENFKSPVWSSLMALFTGQGSNVIVTHVFYHIKTETKDGLEGDWNSLNRDIATADKNSPGGHRPDTVGPVNLVGTQDTFYLYVAYGQPWLEYVSYMASAITLLLAILVVGRPRDLVSLLPSTAAFAAWFTGLYSHDANLLPLAALAAVATLATLALLRARDVAAIMIPMLLASVWWAGLLPLFGIKASLTLMLPTVFLISVGSDYAIQYVWNYRQQGDMARVYGSTGKANLYVVAATVLAFLLFVPMKLVLSSQGALAAALAILVIFTVTTLLVPLFYPEGKHRWTYQHPPAPPPAASGK
jgi:predicted RND superfamily exporter protein